MNPHCLQEAVPPNPKVGGIVVALGAGPDRKKDQEQKPPEEGERDSVGSQGYSRGWRMLGF